ncbi:hypothetical protein [Actinomadura parmotrematis]|uniref:Uncharacterized protein n=1 Tax=Actinomadura parmotrematis TaxID=2864039 RepID=A0ABS7G3H3_9ACTN|nr:hypothetical protein [Actinomadura parmotrematis]MBW8487247.1 hypothetical protein [Actinomadura parmotrematis]
MTDLTHPRRLMNRRNLITGLRALADFLEDNPAVPIPRGTVTVSMFARGDSQTCQRAAVDGVAALLGVPVQDETHDGGHYTAAKHFGPIAYQAIHIPTERQHAHRALMTYAPNFDPPAPNATDNADPSTPVTGSAGDRRAA